MGAWIEIEELDEDATETMSLLSWERGLKLCRPCATGGLEIVAPLVGAWIEIYNICLSDHDGLCRSSRGSVD